jgi:hypothetical protein
VLNSNNNTILVINVRSEQLQGQLQKENSEITAATEMHKANHSEETE